MEGYRLFRRDRQGRRGGGVALYVRERLDCTALTVSDNVVENLWVRIRKVENKGDVVGVYYQSPSQDDSTYELFYKQLGEISGSVALVLMGDSNFPDINWEYHTVVTSKSGKFLKYVEDNFLSQVLCEPTRKDALLGLLFVNREGLVGDVMQFIQTSFKYLQGWRLNHFPGQPVPMLDNPFSEEKFPNIQSKPPLAQLEGISSRPITCYLTEETDTHLSTTSFQVVVDSNKVSPQPPFLQAKQSQFPQPLLIRLVLQTLHQLHWPSLDTLQHLNVLLVVRRPKLNTVLEGHNHFPSPAGHTISDTSQDAIGLLGHLGTLQPLFPKPITLHGVVVTQVQDLALSLVKPHTIGLGPSMQPVQVPLYSLPTLKQINTPTQLGVVCKLTEGALDPFVQIIDKDIKQNWPQHRALGNTACDWPPTGVNSIHHHSLGPAIQPVLYPAKSTPVQAMSSQFLQENAVGNRVKGFTEV
ncbi:hypothetical protein QYF61_027329 [Mycteria americana]|uniref:Uncharacterized protein n=1 Tax=Mycteria americana TaxID=33587 RepID=A0AAN7MZX5_MYCAM|nr:hypothetical protein QYF61_027329 [Mycteria americana]